MTGLEAVCLSGSLPLLFEKFLAYCAWTDDFVWWALKIVMVNSHR